MRWLIFIVFVSATSLPIVGLLIMATKEEAKPNFKGGLNRGSPIPPPKPRQVSHHRRRSIFARCLNFRAN